MFASTQQGGDRLWEFLAHGLRPPQLLLASSAGGEVKGCCSTKYRLALTQIGSSRRWCTGYCCRAMLQFKALAVPSCNYPSLGVH